VSFSCSGFALVSYFGDDRDLVRVHFDVTLDDDVTQELSLGDPKGAFF
jgi:hypothetical protein